MTTTTATTTRCVVCAGTGNDPDFSTPTVAVECGACNGHGHHAPTFRTAATDKQQAFANRLIDEIAAMTNDDRALGSVAGIMERFNEASTVREASAQIDALIQLQRTIRQNAPKADRPATAPAGLDLSDVPAGFYAVPNGTTRLKVKIDKVTKGKWAGWTFVKDGAVYGSEARYGSQKPGQFYSGRIAAELAAIAADPAAAMAEYGHLTGSCGRCNRPLEDADSVARGIGPVCAGKMGW
jgi:hypothetical protein